MTVSNPFELTSLDGDNGFILFNDQPFNAYNNVGYSVSEAGDINGDGIDDLIVGTSGIQPILEPTPNNPGALSFTTGTSYVVFGRDDGFSENINLAELDGSDGFALSGNENLYGNRHFVSDAGDFNGDGIDDIAIGAPYGGGGEIGTFFTGIAYVVFGRDDGFDAELDLLDLEAGEGITVEGTQVGYSVSSLGDINGDGLDDVSIGSGSGVGYVVFGSQDELDPFISVNTGRGLVSDLDGTNGFTLEAESFLDQEINGIGDFNGDGINDFIARDESREEVVIIFGRDRSSFGANLDITNLDSSEGITLRGLGSVGFRGVDFDGIGDVNNDGIDDLSVVTRPSESDSNEGTAQIIFGSRDGSSFANGFDLADIDGTNGFRITDLGTSDDERFISISGAGDFNGDGIDDFILRLSDLSLGGETVGASFVIFGREDSFQSDIDLADIDGNNGFLIPNRFIDSSGALISEELGFRVSEAGDINNDGTDDIILGSRDNGFVIFGQTFQSSPEQPDPQPPTLDFANRIFATDGADEIALGGSEQVAFGLAGDDVIDFRFDSGANRAFGGDGDDTFLLGSGDRIFGVDGNDTFIVGSGGGNVITGNRGDDQYIIADGVIPESVNTITDFVTGDDLLVIQNLGASFEDLSFRDSAEGAIVALNGEDLVVLTNRNANFIGNADNFLFVDPTPETPEFTQVFANDGDNNILATDSNEVFFGLGGDDVIDFRSDTGANRAFGGDGNDIFLLGSGDRIFGVGGNDRFFLSSGGENVITGNRGEDQYIVDGVIPESANTITDFVVGDDLIVIQGLGVGFADLGFRDSADGAIVSLNGSDLAVLTNRNANFIANENNFDFVG